MEDVFVLERFTFTINLSRYCNLSGVLCISVSIFWDEIIFLN